MSIFLSWLSRSWPSASFVARCLLYGLACYASACAASAPAARNAPATAAAKPADSNDQLGSLWESRTNGASKEGFGIGPGDILAISVARIDQLNNQKVRVSEDGTIALPLIGEMQVAGLNEDGVRKELEDRLHKYVYHPQVTVFVSEYHSRQVAVIGAVQKPGLYTLSSRSNTIIEMISEAGGMTSDAAERVILVPDALYHDERTAQLVQASISRSHPEGSENGQPSAAPAAEGSEAAAQPMREGPLPVKAVSTDAGIAPVLRSAADPVVIDLTNASRQSHLDLPARPGNVIIVPSSGTVMVEGWVQTAGAYKIVPGMTVLSSVAAAGGALFSASARVVRTGPDGQKMELSEDLSKAKTGEANDIAVESGDVVIVERSALGAVPYSVYFLLQRFNTGIPIPVF